METPFEDDKPTAEREMNDPPPRLSGDELDVAIRKAIGELDPENEAYWTDDNKPVCNILTSMLRQKVTSEQRDRVWEAMQAEKQAQEEAREAAKAAPPSPAEPDMTDPAPLAPRTGLKWAGKWAVKDMNARAGVARIHHPMGINAEAVHLRSDRPTELPREIAAKFLCDPSFEVYNAFGDRVENLPDSEVTVAGRSTSFDLSPNEVVAKLSELSIEALLIRVNRMPGGEEFNEASNRTAIEDFYVEARQKILRGEDSGYRGPPMDGIPEMAGAGDDYAQKVLGGM